MRAESDAAVRNGESNRSVWHMENVSLLIRVRQMLKAGLVESKEYESL